MFPEDDEAYNIWHNEIKIPPERIRRFGESDNFWPASAPSQAPTEFVARAAKSSIIRRPAAKWRSGTWCSRNSIAWATRRIICARCRSKNIDTGMGLDRTASMLQGVDTNFHIDILRPIVEAAAEVCHMKYDPNSETGRRLWRITDHVRGLHVRRFWDQGRRLTPIFSLVGMNS